MFMQHCLVARVAAQHYFVFQALCLYSQVKTKNRSCEEFKIIFSPKLNQQVEQSREIESFNGIQFIIFSWAIMKPYFVGILIDAGMFNEKLPDYFA
jgi:hypothetical protein